ncbi:glycosyltransferase family 2 protein [Streptomyces alkaliphilus]|uniref:glycosyltransferase family 2 protein n=1 Tax=Streptomyces alkaliphilus TaxID=1472722 RepID=UPI0015659BF8
MTETHHKEVSVLIPVHNAMPYLEECLRSIDGQSLHPRHMEVILVDDGSTDGSTEEIRRWVSCRPHSRAIFRKTPSGGPSRPRNEALARAEGRYVFFLDADDLLGPEALERMLRMAKCHDSDVVVGKMVGMGRGVSKKAFKQTGKVDLHQSEVYRSLSPQKLVRRGFLTDRKIIFDENFWYGEDQIFMADLYLSGASIAVVGDYDCYYIRAREDGGNTTRRSRTIDESVGHIEVLLDMVREKVETPSRRAHLMVKHFRELFENTFLPGLREGNPELREEVWERCSSLFIEYWSDEMGKNFSAFHAFLSHLIREGRKELCEELAARGDEVRDGEELLEGGRVYRRFPFFRDGRSGVPDHVFDVTDRLLLRIRTTSLWWRGETLCAGGISYIDRLPTGNQKMAIVFRHRETGEEHVVPARTEATPELNAVHLGRPWDHGSAGWLLELAPENLDLLTSAAPGVWDAHLSVSAEGVVKEKRLPGPKENEVIAFLGPKVTGGAASMGVVLPYITDRGKFSIRVEKNIKEFGVSAVLSEASWQGDRLLIEGTVTVPGTFPARRTGELILRRRARGVAPTPGNIFSRIFTLRRNHPMEDQRREEIRLPCSMSPDSASGRADETILLFRSEVDGKRLAEFPHSAVVDCFLGVANGDGPELEGRMRSRLPEGEPSVLGAGRVLDATGQPTFATPYRSRGGYFCLDVGGVSFPLKDQLHLCLRSAGESSRRKPRISLGFAGFLERDVHLEFTSETGTRALFSEFSSPMVGTSDEVCSCFSERFGRSPILFLDSRDGVNLGGDHRGKIKISFSGDPNGSAVFLPIGEVPEVSCGSESRGNLPGARAVTQVTPT